MWPAVELREIRAFLTLAEELHFGRAAERLSLSPSRVSQTIRTLEAQIGGRLFERTSRRVRLTPLGEQLQATIGPPYEQMQRAYSDARELATGVAGTVRLAVFLPADGGPHLLEVITTFEARHPACRVHMTETNQAREQLDWLRRGDADVMAMRLPVTRADVVVGPILFREEHLLAVSSEHPLATRESVCLDDLADYLVSDVPSITPGLMRAVVPRRAPSGRALRRAEAHSIPEAMMRVAGGEIVHATVPSLLDFYHQPGVTGIPIRDLPLCEIALVWLKANENPTIKAFARAATDVLQSHDLSPASKNHSAPSPTRRVPRPKAKALPFGSSKAPR
jgi:DNA-binding transcriptional LysR family regulator